MSILLIKTVKPVTNEQVDFYYDNQNSIIYDKDMNKIVYDESIKSEYTPVFATSIVTPATKSNDIKVLKIQLGLSCNYECSYCNQRFVPHADETTKDDVQPFLDSMDSWIKSDEFKVEFWGGEPFVYWKTLKPLAEGIKAKYPKATFGIVTNGTLLDKEKNEWLENLGFGVGISHDGPGYHIRGLDPFDNKEQLDMIQDLWQRLFPKGQIGRAHV